MHDFHRLFPLISSNFQGALSDGDLELAINETESQRVNLRSAINGAIEEPTPKSGPFGAERNQEIFKVLVTSVMLQVIDKGNAGGC